MNEAAHDHTSSAHAAAASPRYVRRAPFLVVSWTATGAQVTNYATRRTLRADSLALSILDGAAGWLHVDDIVRRPSGGCDAAQIARVIDSLIEHTMLNALGRPVPPAERALALWAGWNPAAGFFHHASRGMEWAPVTRNGRPPLVSLHDPERLGEHHSGTHVELPAFDGTGELAGTLLRRRTWRRFGPRRVTLRELSTMLGLTFAVQHWVDVDGERVALRTSPSGGARHSIEAYVVALDVAGLARGTYHYCPDTHGLRLLDGTTARADVAEIFPAGSGFDGAGAVIFATAVFGRVQRKYDSARAYRVVLLEAGHFCQTFCLVATSLDLAPFCTAAFVDSAVERLLRIDGIGEAAIYAMGVGSQPEDAAWAPWPDGADPPAFTPPSWAASNADSTKCEGDPGPSGR